MHIGKWALTRLDRCRLTHFNHAAVLVRAEFASRIQAAKRSKPPARHAGWSCHWQLGGPILVAENPSERSHDLIMAGDAP